jgi:hypothetical protein
MMAVQRIDLHGKWITKALAVTIVLLAIAHLVFQAVRYHLGIPHLYGVVHLFDMGVEANLPTYFSSLQLLFVAALLGLIGVLRRRSGDRYALHWLWLALIFLLLSIDEMSEIHEMSIRPMRELAPDVVTGFFYWAWVIPAMALVVVVAACYASFVFRYLPPYLRRAALLGAAVFVGGAVGVEMPEAAFVEANGLDNYTYALFVVVEEVMEMTGVLIFLAGLLRYIGSELGEFSLRIVPPAAAAVRPTEAALAPAVPVGPGPVVPVVTEKAGAASHPGTAAAASFPHSQRPAV